MAAVKRPYRTLWELEDQIALISGALEAAKLLLLRAQTTDDVREAEFLRRKLCQAMETLHAWRQAYREPEESD